MLPLYPVATFGCTKKLMGGGDAAALEGVCANYFNKHICPALAELKKAQAELRAEMKKDQSAVHAKLDALLAGMSQKAMFTKIVEDDADSASETEAATPSADSLDSLLSDAETKLKRISAKVSTSLASLEEQKVHALIKSKVPMVQLDTPIANKTRDVLGKYFDVKKTYTAKYVIRPDNAEVAKLPVLTNNRLTPKNYDRNTFHFEMDVNGTELAGYEAGDCIGVYPENPQDKVSEFLNGMGFDETELLELDTFFAGEEDGVYVMSVQQLCIEYLDLFGPPSRSFYLALAKYSHDFVEKEYLAELSLPRKAAEFEKREALAVTYASTILEFRSLKLTPSDLLDLVPTTKPRLYSIASSPNAHPGQVHLLIVTHTWDTSDGQEKVGLSTGYLENMFPNHDGHPATVVASLVRSPVLKLPQDPSKPVIMAGMGTGMAPFRAFIEERAVMWSKGQAVGSMRLYFGARHKHGEFYYQDQLEEYSDQGWLALRCAWSRDQKQKIYVQNLMEQDGDALWEALKPEAGGSFYICGPIAPLPDIKKAILKVFEQHGLDSSYLDEMEATGRFATEVY